MRVFKLEGRGETVTICKGHDTIENSCDSSQKLLELRDEFSKGAAYKINIQKLVAFVPQMKYQKGMFKKKQTPF